MKVLYVMASSEPTIGGMEKQLALQVNAIAEMKDAQGQSIETQVIASPYFAELYSNKVSFSPLNMERSRRNLALLYQIAKKIKQFKPDLVHAHGHKAAQICSSLRRFHSSTKFIATAHNLKKNNKAMANMDRVIAVSEGVQKALAPIPADVVNNGVEPAPATKVTKQSFCAELGIDASLPLVFGLGRLVKTKQFDVLIKAAKGLAVNVVILGDGPEKEQLKSLNSENVVFAGYRSDVRQLLTIGDLLAITASRDGFSLALIEALHSRLPVFSTRVPGAQDLLPEKCLLESGDVTGLRTKLEEHTSKLDELAIEMAPMFEFAQTELTVEKAAQHTLDIYEARL